MDVNNAILFLTVLGALLMGGGLWALLKPRNMPDIDAANFKPKSIEELPSPRFMGSWGGGVRHHSDSALAGPKGLWDNEIDYYEKAMERRLAINEEEKERRPRGDRIKRGS